MEETRVAAASRHCMRRLVLELLFCQVVPESDGRQCRHRVCQGSLIGSCTPLTCGPADLLLASSVTSMAVSSEGMPSSSWSVLNHVAYRRCSFIVLEYSQITGILFQLPSGLSNGGLFTSASQATIGNSSFYVSGFQTALQLVSTCIGLTVGLGISLVVVFPVQSRKRQAGVFSL